MSQWSEMAPFIVQCCFAKEIYSSNGPLHGLEELGGNQENIAHAPDSHVFVICHTSHVKQQWRPPLHLCSLMQVSLPEADACRG